MVQGDLRQGCLFRDKARRNARLKFAGQHLAPNEKTGVDDDTVELELQDAHETYPWKLLRVKIHDSKTGKVCVFLTDSFRVSAETIATIYRR